MAAPATTRLLLETPEFQVGEFRCGPGHPLWDEVNDNIGPRPHLVFPQTSVYIDQGSAERVLATPNHVVLYASHELYRRELHDPRGDLSVFVTLDPGLFESIAGGRRHPLDPSDAQTYLDVRLLVQDLREETRPDNLLAEETLYRLAGHSARRRAESRAPSRLATRRGHLELVEAAKDVVSRRLAEAISLHALARDLHTSPFHLSRVFRDVTGFTLHDYRIHLRLRRSLESVLEPGADLTRIAHELGFCSLSHFSGSFKRVFGRSPSSVRGAAGEARKIVEAKLAAAS